MAHLKFASDRGSARALRTPADLLKRIGRTLLWVLAIVLLIRGTASLVATDRPAAATVVSPPAHPTVTWPDDEARAFAVDFARAYLTAPAAASLQDYVTPELATTVAADFEDGTRQDVGAVTVARVTALGGSRALITVAAAVGPDVLYLAVPVARDKAGGVVVTDLPSLVGPPARAVVEAPANEPVDSSERTAIEDVSKRFLTAYLAGDAEGLEYLVPPGTRISAVGREYELVGITALQLASPPKGDTRAVWVSVRARDVQSRAIYGLRYHLELVRDDRWYVAAVTGG